MNDVVNYLYSFIYTPPINHGARNVEIVHKNLCVLKEYLINTKEKYKDFEKYIDILNTKFDTLIFKSIDENYVVDKKTIYLNGSDNINNIFINSLKALTVCVLPDNYPKKEFDDISDFFYNISKELYMI
jgi:hypothetical protein